MSYCPKCGNKVDETMVFCPRCGASLKGATPGQVPPAQPYRNEKTEKKERREKQEKREQPEKGEKQEKGEFSYIGWLIGGIIVIVIGILAFANASGYVTSAVQNAIVLLVIGFVIVLVAVWMSMRARSRNPAPPV